MHHQLRSLVFRNQCLKTTKMLGLRGSKTLLQRDSAHILTRGTILTTRCPVKSVPVVREWQHLLPKGLLDCVGVEPEQSTINYASKLYLRDI